MSRIAIFTGLAVPFMAAALLVSCRQEPDPGIIEKVNLLEAEIRDRDSQITALRSELDAAAESEPAAPAAPDLDAARSAYFGFVESLQGKLAEAMPDAEVAAPTMFPVDGPDMAYPIISKAGYRITRADGSVGEVTIPLAASPSGDWEMPDTGAIAASFKAIPASRPKPTRQAAAPAPEARPKPVDVMGAGRTVEVQWPEDKRPAAPQKPAPQQPRQPAASTKPALPKKVMPTDRDVIIDFE
jgi:hypothetical protein